MALTVAGPRAKKATARPPAAMAMGAVKRLVRACFLKPTFSYLVLWL